MSRLTLFLFVAAVLGHAQDTVRITTPKEALGFNLGDDYQVASYSQLDAYWHKLASESDRMKLVDIGPTAENRRQYMAIISAPETIKRLDHYKDISRRLARAEGLTDEQAHALAREGKAVVWIDGGLHASETVGSQQEMEEVYEMVSRTDPETMRILNDDILLCVLANPDGQELVANWYMREVDPVKRSLRGLPVLFQHYIGHDNNRDFYMSNMPETTNMNRQMFLEWFPQIVYNHHQTGPAGAVIFMPPFRDPFNYHFDPLIPLGVEAVGTAMHQRLVAEGKGGSVQRSGANYSTWWNGGLRTIAYFHNMIGLLTEIIGNPTPIQIPLVAEKQLPTGDWPLPVAPRTWHYRQSIEYEMSNNRAVLDYASRYRETLLYNFYRMGRNSIEDGSQDHWTVTPDRIDALRSSAPSKPSHELPPGLTTGGLGGTALPVDLYQSVLHSPRHRDPRGYIIPSNQPDFPTAVKFVNALLKTGVTVRKAAATFQVNDKTYPAGSYIVKTDQAFRPHVMDMFEPQIHPNDLLYPGGPPIPPYDNAGWTLALQMGIEFDRILDGFDGPFVVLDGLQAPPPGAILGAGKPAGYLISHRTNDAFIAINRLLQANCPAYWLANAPPADGEDLGTGTVWIPESSVAREILEQVASKYGISVHGVAAAPAGQSFKLKPIRIGLYDQYGGSIASGWTHWLFERYEFPFEVVYPKTLDAGNLNSRFDVLLFPDVASDGPAQPAPETIPEKYRPLLGHLTEETAAPQLRKFIQAGGSIVTVGRGSTRMADWLDVPIDGYITAPREKYYVPGSLLKVEIDNRNPLAYGMPKEAVVFFDNSPVFKLRPNAAAQGISAVAWFTGTKPLVSGWAWGEQLLDGGTAVAEASLGRGKLFLLGPEVTFRGQSHGTFKLLFNALYAGSAEAATIPVSH